MQRPATNRRISTTLAGTLVLVLLPMGLIAIAISVRSHIVSGGGSLQLSAATIIGIVVPVLIWCCALLAAWFAIHRLVVQPLRAIERGMTVYGRSSDPARAQLRFGTRDFGSTELARLAASFDTMANEIDAQSRDLRGALVEQQRLTREVHHRVKNNLQIVSSLLSLQARAAVSIESAQAYAFIQARLAALMHVHRWMYDDVTSNGVDLAALAAELCAGLETSLISTAHPVVAVACETAAIVLHADVAVPVAFLVTELANLAALNGAPGRLQIRVTAAVAGDLICLTIESAGFVGADTIAAASLNPTARIINGMARQLRSSLIHDAAVGCYTVTFSGSAN